MGFLPSSQCGGQFALAFHEDWSEPAATNALVQDEAVLLVLGMNQKHILFSAQGFFSPLLCPKIFVSYLLPRPSYLPHLISRSFHLQSLGEFPSLSSTELRGDVNTRLEKGGELNVEGMWRGENKKNASSQMQKLPPFFACFSFSTIFFSLCFFSFLLFEKKKMPRENA